MTAVAMDTSLAVPLMMRRHTFHRTTVDWLGDRTVVLAGHAAAETYSVATRLPADARLSPTDAATLIAASFDGTIVLDGATAKRIPQILSEAGIHGGAVYDALVGLAAREHGYLLATRDGRAKQTYTALGVQVELVA